MRIMQQLEMIRRQTAKSNSTGKRNLFGLFLIATFALHALTLLGLLSLTFAFHRVANRPPPSLVQAVDGRSIAVSPMESRDRTPITIRRFVGDALPLLLSSSGKLPPSADQPGAADPGVPIEIPNRGQTKISTSAWQAGFALSEDFRPAALQAIAGLTAPATFTGQAQTMLVPQHISDPEKLGDGQWKVNVIANLVTITANQPQGTSVPFNKAVYLRAIDVPQPHDVATPLEKAVYTVRQSGLEIYAMKDYAPGAIKQ
jgi:hypothetical protein